MDLTGKSLYLHMRSDANNLVTTATTTHLPEQKETIHMINQLRHESCSGSIDDLAHVVSEDCLSDCLTKHSAKSTALIKAVNTGVLPHVDKHPPFRELMKTKHKAYHGASLSMNETDDEQDEDSSALISWLTKNLSSARNVLTFLNIPVRNRIESYLSFSTYCIT